ncbi:unannotated protein [freshwater metagenome]|uniref:Unannotated protein n=1 Tax=freshwater metagenome TaxID=449393 RepID=A0A6J7P3I4_9ZZZZ
MPSLSAEPAEEKLTASPWRTVEGVATATAVGATFGMASAVMLIEAESVSPSMSATVKVATYAPGML